jgi:hypothetical protein
MVKTPFLPMEKRFSLNNQNKNKYSKKSIIIAEKIILKKQL